MSRIGIMGGTFNPIHKGHIQIAQSAYEQYDLDAVWFMPNHIPAYKATDELVSEIDRLAMVELAIRKIPYFCSSDYELQREGNTYTWETLKGLKEEYPDSDFYFIMGADSLMYFDKWVHPERIVSMAHILVAARDHSSDEQLQAKIMQLEQLYSCSDFHILRCEEIDCSSSKLRQELAAGNPDNLSGYIQSYLDPAVLRYIQDKRLYRK